MRRKTILSCTISILFAFLTTSSFSQQNSDSWKQFRGNDRSGSSSYQIKVERLPSEGPKMLWKKSLGAAFAEITVDGDRIYTMFSEKFDTLHGLEYVGAFDPVTGNQIWKTIVDSLYIENDGWGDGPRSTPAVGKELIFSLSGKGKLTANSKTDGKIVWQIDLVKDFESVMPRWGFTSSPTLVDNQLIMEVGGSNSRLFVAFNPEDGKVIWSKGTGNSSYNSPVYTNINGQNQIIFANGRTIYSFDSKGDTLWTFKSMIASPTAVPVIFDSNKIFISAIRTPGFMIAEVKDNKVKEILNGNTMKTDFNTVVYYDGYIYGFNVAALSCISAKTGETKWVKRGFGNGSLILVGNKLIVLSDQGKVIMAKATPEAFTEQGSFQALKGKCWTAPSFSNGKLYVRNLTEMACFDFNF